MPMTIAIAGASIDARFADAAAAQARFTARRQPITPSYPERRA